MIKPKLDPCKHCGCDAVYEGAFFAGVRVVCANRRCGISTPYHDARVGTDNARAFAASIWNRKPTNTMEKTHD